MRLFDFKVWHRIFRRLRSLCNSPWRVATGEAHVSYSQTGEDMLLLSFLRSRLDDLKYKGFWVDIGAHHPTRFSNTKIFYDSGWRGINVDAMPSAIDLFNRQRKRDINVNVGIGEKRGSLEFFRFSDCAVNTFSQEFAEKVKASGMRYLGSSRVDVITIKDLLDAHLPPGQNIDFISIDTEGLDISILRSNDWSLYRPDYVLIEIHTAGHNERISEGEVCRYLHERGYEFVAQSFSTSLFEKTDLRNHQ